MVNERGEVGERNEMNVDERKDYGEERTGKTRDERERQEREV